MSRIVPCWSSTSREPKFEHFLTHSITHWKPRPAPTYHKKIHKKVFVTMPKRKLTVLSPMQPTTGASRA